MLFIYMHINHKNGLSKECKTPQSVRVKSKLKDKVKDEMFTALRIKMSEGAVTSLLVKHFKHWNAMCNA